MNYNRQDNKYGGIAMRAVCAILFLLFTVLYLLYQQDLLAFAQFRLSRGVTHYDATVGTIVITSTLFIIYIMVTAMTKLRGVMHALAFFPSLLTLMMITDVSPDVSHETGLGWWWLVLPLAIGLWLLAVIIGRHVEDMMIIRRRHVAFSVSTLVNFGLLAGMFCIVGLVGSGNDVFHYRLKMERYLMQGDTDKALRVADEAKVRDADMTALRAIALCKKGEMGEKLFSFPVCGNMETLLPHDTTAFLMLPPAEFYKMIGAAPQDGMSGREYMKALLYTANNQQEDTTRAITIDRKALGDYQLCSALLEKDLNRFASLLPDYYDIDSILPLYYREALVLYCHTRSNPKVLFKDDVTETNYRDMVKMERKYSDRTERSVRVARYFAQTYWFYYNYL